MKKILQIFITLIVSVFLYSCHKESFITSKSAKLEFSVDTVLFDTVFTGIGSTTKQLLVYNIHNDWIKISEISLATGSYSKFRLNVNGDKGFHFNNVEIPPDDSIFVFVEVTVDPNGQNSPVVIQDSIIFLTNENTQDIDLVAFGQDYHLINGQYVGSQTWINDKPYLIYNSMAVDSAATLEILAGCQLYFHRNSSLYVLGTLKVLGSKDQPVVFQGDRLEQMYDDVTGQWGNLHFVAGSKDNFIDYAIIKNAIIGVRVDTFSNASPTLTISNTIINNMSAYGLYGLGAHVKANNCVITNCGIHNVLAYIGGQYDFYHCTIANYWSFSTRVTPSVVLNNWYEDINGDYHVRQLEKASFWNCIIYGNLETEILTDIYPGTQNGFNYFFDYCLLKSDTSFDLTDNFHFSNSLRNLDPKFISAYDFNFKLDTLSPAKDKGNLSTATMFPFDIEGNSRISDGKPDIGAYERIE